MNINIKIGQSYKVIYYITKHNTQYKIYKKILNGKSKLFYKYFK